MRATAWRIGLAADGRCAILRVLHVELRRVPSGGIGRDTAPRPVPDRLVLRPEGEGWLHEVKQDGHRLLAIIDAAAVTESVMNSLAFREGLRSSQGGYETNCIRMFRRQCPRLRRGRRFDGSRRTSGLWASDSR